VLRLQRLPAASLQAQLYGEVVTKTYKTFVATWAPVGGAVRVVLVRETTGWVAFFCTDPAAGVADVLGLIAALGWSAVRRSELPCRRRADTVIVLDTLGELAQLYSVASVVFVGGSLVPAGGHNMLEPASRRKPVLFGPHTENFRDAAALLLDAGAATLVQDAEDLALALGRLLADPALRAKMGDAGVDAVASRHGAVGETLALVSRFLLPHGAPP